MYIDLRNYKEEKIILSGSVETAYKTTYRFDFILPSQEALDEVKSGLANYAHGLLLNHLLDESGNLYDNETVTRFVDNFHSLALQIAQAMIDLSTDRK
jgi:hypothetical protein